MPEIQSLKINVIEIKGQRDKFYAVTAGHELASSQGMEVLVHVGRRLHRHMEGGQ